MLKLVVYTVTAVIFRTNCCYSTHQGEDFKCHITFSERGAKLV